MNEYSGQYMRINAVVILGVSSIEHILMLSSIHTCSKRFFYLFCINIPILSYMCGKSSAHSNVCVKKCTTWKTRNAKRGRKVGCIFPLPTTVILSIEYPFNAKHEHFEFT